MNQTTATTATNKHLIDVEALRFQLEEGGKDYHASRNSNSLEAHDRLLHTLQTNDCREIITAIADGDSIVLFFLHAGTRGHVDILEAGLNHGMNINIKNKNGYTALMCASCNNQKECVRFLLDRNASVDAQNNYGETALLWASYRGFTDVVEILLEKNANPNIQSNRSSTALMCASMECHKNVVQALLDHNADIALKSNHGKTALDAAKTEEIKEMIRNHVFTGYVLK